MSNERQAQDLLTQCLMSAVQSAHPAHCLEPHLPPPPETGRIFLLAGGKAAGEMMKTACGHYLKTVDKKRIIGVAVHHHAPLPDLFHIEQITAGHPIPNKNSQKGAQRVLELARLARTQDLVIALLSGGASALWSAPVEGVTLDDKQTITNQLLRSGANIFEINCVRKHLSSIKGGQLANAVAPAHLVTLTISDVVGDAPSVIASGPTVGDPTTQEEALKVLENYKISIPPRVKSALINTRHETLAPDAPIFRNTHTHCIANGASALAAAEQLLVEQGVSVINLGDRIEGEAREQALQHAHMAKRHQNETSPVALLSGGELTVTIKGTGIGGPSQEYALALAIALDGAQNIYAIAADTDGCDGGPVNTKKRHTQPAGALIFPSTLARAKEKKLNPATFLEHNDSGSFFHKLEDLVMTGPTHTNVNDFRLILINTIWSE